MKDGELAVLFRNNHFSVMLKRRNVSNRYHYVKLFITISSLHVVHKRSMIDAVNILYSVGAIFVGYRSGVFEGAKCGLGDIVLC